MTTERSPAFQFYPREFVGDLDVAALTLEEVGFYTLLLCYAWLKDGLPADMPRLARALRVAPSKFDKLWVVIGEKFPVAPDGRLRNERQEEEREKQRRHREERSLSGRKGNEKRYGEARSAVAQRAPSDKNDLAKARSSSSSASSSAFAFTETPTASVAPVASGPHRSHAYCSIACVPSFLHQEFRAGLNRENQDEADDELRAGYRAHVEAWPKGKAAGDAVKFWRAWYQATYPAPSAKELKGDANDRALEAWMNRDREAES
jgi:uncharacterized protein YdaU (DUF1376 family)